MTPAAEEYATFVHQFMDKRNKGMPHCDELVLHDPGLCNYCGMKDYKPVQAKRRALGINYTGSRNPDLDSCPAEQRRGIETIELWHGNVLMDDDDIEESDKEHAVMIQLLEQHLAGR